MASRAVGIDLGAKALHVVVVDTALEPFPIVAATVVLPTEGDALRSLCAGAQAVAIDAPSDPSSAPHAADATLSPKFRVARCGEIALGQDHRSWVPWVTPEAVDTSPAWMQVGFHVWQLLRDAGHAPMEVYPSGAFRALAEAKLPKKSTVDGRSARRDLLERHAGLPKDAATWGHDLLDATVAALVAAWSVTGGPVAAARHDHDGADGSAIWIPVGG